MYIQRSSGRDQKESGRPKRKTEIRRQAKEIQDTSAEIIQTDYKAIKNTQSRRDYQYIHSLKRLLFDRITNKTF